MGLWSTHLSSIQTLTVAFIHCHNNRCKLEWTHSPKHLGSVVENCQPLHSTTANPIKTLFVWLYMRPTAYSTQASPNDSIWQNTLLGATDSTLHPSESIYKNQFCSAAEGRRLSHKATTAPITLSLWIKTVRQHRSWIQNVHNNWSNKHQMLKSLLIQRLRTTNAKPHHNYHLNYFT